MTGATSRDLLQRLLEGEPITPEYLDALLINQPAEDLHLEYKDGLVTSNDVPKAKRIVREATSAFGNAEGGTLVIGVSEELPRRVSACTPIGGRPLDDWAGRVLSDMVAFFSPPPRFQVVQHSSGPVLLIAVGRAPQLVPCVESRQLRYFIRIGESTVEAPAYLISDLVLGRRQHPILDVSIASVKVGRSELKNPHFPFTHSSAVFGFSFIIENVGLIEAREIEVGLVAWCVAERHYAINRHLLTYVNAEASPNVHGPGAVQLPWGLCHCRNNSSSRPRPTVEPFSSATTDLVGTVALPVMTPPSITRCRSALCLMPRGAPPTWFVVDYDPHEVVDRPGAVRVERAVGRVPVEVI